MNWCWFLIKLICDNLLVIYLVIKPPSSWGKEKAEPSRLLRKSMMMSWKFSVKSMMNSQENMGIHCPYSIGPHRADILKSHVSLIFPQPHFSTAARDIYAIVSLYCIQLSFILLHTSNYIYKIMFLSSKNWIFIALIINNFSILCFDFSYYLYTAWYIIKYFYTHF